jgi:hypothetical protein
MVDPNILFGRLGNRLFKEAYLYAQAREGYIPDVYVQNQIYFDSYREELRALFGQGFSAIPYVGIHVRRGDYVDSKFHVDLTQTNYYEKAIDLFPDKEFLVFSDDSAWCKKHFTSKNFQVVEGRSEVEDFNLLASCTEGNIIANSSFSWWAAYLNPHHPKITAPQENLWFHDGQVRCHLPSDWEQISYER